MRALGPAALVLAAACAEPAVCADDLQPSFASIREKVFRVSCGTATSTCHSAEGAQLSGGMNLEDDPYRALLAPANNQEGSVKGLQRVKPGDPEQSFLVIKLRTTSSADPRYGSGMPFLTPGSVCDDTLDAIRAWIAAGAPEG